jgi:hypothetical protein
MSIVGLAALLAVIFGVGGGLLALIGSRPNFAPAGFGAAGTFALVFLLNWAFMYTAPPTFAGAGLLGYVLVDAIMAFIVFFAADAAFSRTGGGVIVAGVTAIVLLLAFGPFYNYYFMGQGNVDKLVAKLNVELVKADPNNPDAAYPDTDNDHMVFGDQIAMQIANGVGNQGNLGTRYNMFPGVLQERDGHMYYLFAFNADGRRNTEKVKGLAPGYVEVDAENPNAKPRLVTGDANGTKYAIRYWPSGWNQTDLERHIWSYKDASGNTPYQHRFKEGLTFETDDTGRPFYTATLNAPVVRWRDSLPETFITVDAQNGAITEYRIPGVKIDDPKEAARVASLPEVPAWVDRVYSRSDAEHMIKAWAHWGHVNEAGKRDAPYQELWDNKNNRFKIDDEDDFGGLNLVYTKNGPAWQAVLTSVRRSTVAHYIVLMDTRSPNARVYPAPQGMKIERDVAAAINDAPTNIKRYDPTALGLYKINKQLTWAASLVPDGKANVEEENSDPAPAGYSGFAVLDATNAVANRAITGNDKATVFTAYLNQIAAGTTNPSPARESMFANATGTVASIQTPVAGGNTIVVIRLVGDKHLYKAPFADTEVGLSMVSVKEGDNITIRYISTDSNAVQRNISTVVNNSLTKVTK